MIEKIIAWTIIAGAAVYIGRRFYLQWYSAVKGDTASCAENCSCCSDTSCADYPESD